MSANDFKHSQNKKVNKIRKRRKVKLKAKNWLDVYPETPQKMTVDKLKSYPHLDHLSDQQAQLLIHTMEDFCELLLSNKKDL